MPTGSVDFLDTTTGNDLGSVALSGGVAILNTASLPVGSQMITASYGGNVPFLPSSATITVSIVPSIIVLDPKANGALTVSGNAGIKIPGAVVVDSSSSSALSASGNTQIQALVIDIHGGVQKSGNASFSPAPLTGATSLPDPFAGLPSPSTTGLTNDGSVNLSGNSSRTINQGIYSQITVSGNAKLTLNGGIYIIAGGGLTVTGNASISGTGVFVYNAGSKYPNSGGNYGGITLSGNGTFSMTAPTSGTYAGVLIFQSHQNTRALSFSGNAMAGMNGTIYAPNALLSMSGNCQLQSSLDVGMLNLSGNVALTQTAAGSDGTGDTSGIANTLLAGNLSVYINDPGGYFTSDELARIQDAINAWDAILAPYNVTITEVSDPTLANIVLDTSNTSACGGTGQGVLGCYNEANNEITLVQGWDWYAGSDPAQIGAAQYDFETTMLHELGHALGLGGSTDPSSPMYETLAAGVADRTVTTQDLNIPDPPEGADPQIAAGFHFVSAQPALSQNGYAAALGSGADPGLAGLMPLPSGGAASSSGQWSVVSDQRPAANGQTNSQVGPLLSLVVQGMDRQNEQGLIAWVDSESTDFLPPLGLPKRPAEPSMQPAVELEIDSDHPVIPDGADRIDQPVVIPTTLRSDLDQDSILDDLAANVILRSTGFQPVLESSTSKMPVSRSDSPWQSADFSARLAVILLAAGFCGSRAGTSTRTNKRVGNVRPGTRFLTFRRRFKR